jgi:hypothetical protein
MRQDVASLSAVLLVDDERLFRRTRSSMNWDRRTFMEMSGLLRGSHHSADIPSNLATSPVVAAAVVAAAAAVEDMVLAAGIARWNTSLVFAKDVAFIIMLLEEVPDHCLRWRA